VPVHPPPQAANEEPSGAQVAAARHISAISVFSDIDLFIGFLDGIKYLNLKILPTKLLPLVFWSQSLKSTW
jgi:hypothetical protein